VYCQTDAKCCRVRSKVLNVAVVGLGVGVSICSLSRGAEADKSRNSFQSATCRGISKRRNVSTLESSGELQAQVQMHAAKRRQAKRLRLTDKQAKKVRRFAPSGAVLFVVIITTRGRILNHNTLLDYSRLSLGLTFVPFWIFASLLEFVIGFICGFTRTRCFHSRQSASIGSSPKGLRETCN
jgi:hypothetical protein